MEQIVFRKLLHIALILTVVFVVGTVGYHVLEGMSLFTAFYMTVITVSTIGFGELPKAFSDETRILTIIIAFGGMGTLLYGISNVTAFLVEGQLKDILAKRKMSRMIKNLKNHYIVCGSGLMARYICAELQRTLSSFVVVSNDEDVLKRLAGDMEGLKYVVGDVSNDQVLIDCGIKRAQGLVTAQETDQDNLFTIITARRLNPQLRIISVAIAETSIEKLRYAGADGVVSPNFIGSIRMVSELIRPAAVSFLDIMLKDKKSMFRIAETNISEASSLEGKTLKDLRLSDKDKVLVLAIMSRDRKDYSYIPEADTVISAGDTLVVLGGSKQIQELRKRAGDIR